MCGLFGAVAPSDLSDTARDHHRANVIGLGLNAEERGYDSAGLALITASNVTTRRIASRFSDFGYKLDDAFRDATEHIWLGHTRWATQGAVKLDNTSPLTVGPIVGTHNGDIAVSSVPGSAERPEWGTDSWAVFSALAQLRPASTRKAARLLASIHGRAALAWRDTRQSLPTIWLARSGLSPLAVAISQDSTVYWASNPQWLREYGLRPFLLPHGSLWSLTASSNGVDICLRSSWTPTIRRHDLRLLQTAVWRNFTREDRDQDKALLHYTVAREALR